MSEAKEMSMPSLSEYCLLKALLREARQFVNDAGDEEDTEANEHRWELLARIDLALG